MAAFSTIAFQLGQALLDSVWQMALLYGFYRIANQHIAYTAAQRFRLLALLILAGIVLFLAGAAGLKILPFSIKSLPAMAVHPAAFKSGLGMAWQLLAIMYLAALAWFVGHSEWQYRRSIQSFRQVAESRAPAQWRLFVARQARHMGIKKQVQLCISTLTSPATYGWLKPVILLPASCFTTLAPAQVEALLMHEMAHILRHDFLTNRFLLIAEQLLFFNPFMRRLIQQARLECEHACDDWVLQYKYAPQVYSSALLHIAQADHAAYQLLHAAGYPRQQLYHRICRIMQVRYQAAPGTYPMCTFRLTTTFLVSVVLSMLLTFSMQVTDTAQKVSQKQQSIYESSVITRWRDNITDARLAILRGAVGKNFRWPHTREQNHAKTVSGAMAAYEKAIPDSGYKALAVPLTDVALTLETSETEAAKLAWIASHENSHAFAEEALLQAEAFAEGTKAAMKQMEVLTEKLQSARKLKEAEWEKLAGLITLHSEIRTQLLTQTPAFYQDSVHLSLGAPAMLAATEKAMEDAPKVLVIIFDENTGVLAASYVWKDMLPEAYKPQQGASTDERQVLLIRKKAPGKPKVIKL